MKRLALIPLLLLCLSACVMDTGAADPPDLRAIYAYAELTATAQAELGAAIETQAAADWSIASTQAQARAAATATAQAFGREIEQTRIAGQTLETAIAVTSTQSAVRLTALAVDSRAEAATREAAEYPAKRQATATAQAIALGQAASVARGVDAGMWVLSTLCFLAGLWVVWYVYRRTNAALLEREANARYLHADAHRAEALADKQWAEADRMWHPAEPAPAPPKPEHETVEIARRHAWQLAMLIFFSEGDKRGGFSIRKMRTAPPVCSEGDWARVTEFYRRRGVLLDRGGHAGMAWADGWDLGKARGCLNAGAIDFPDGPAPECSASINTGMRGRATGARTSDIVPA